MGPAAPPVGTAAKALGVGPGLVGLSDPWGCLGGGQPVSGLLQGARCSD